jgi:hypothetical protein
LPPPDRGGGKRSASVIGRLRGKCWRFEGGGKREIEAEVKGERKRLEVRGEWFDAYIFRNESNL